MTTLTSSPTLDVELDDAPVPVTPETSEPSPETAGTTSAEPVATTSAAHARTAQELRDAGIAERRARRAHEHATRNRRHDAAGWITLWVGLAVAVGLVGVIAYEGSMVQLRDNGTITSTS
jgi:cobalamin biosynthesis Mg chelatase CobN